MTHIWRGLRTGERLTVARMRAYSLILPGLSVLVLPDGSRFPTA
jgi:hypothetical protein